MKATFNKYGRFVGMAAVTGSTVLATAANATLPTGVATGFTSIQTNIQDVFDLALPVVVLGVVLMTIVRLLKKYGNKAI